MTDSVAQPIIMGILYRLRSRFALLALITVMLVWSPSQAQAQRSLRGDGGASKPCKKEMVMVDGLRRFRCKDARKGRGARRIGKIDTMRREQCTTRGGKRRCKWITYFKGHVVPTKKLRTEPLPPPSGKIWVHSIHYNETYKIKIFNRAGGLSDASLARLDTGFRCRRTRQTRAVDSRLMVILSHIYDRWPGKRIELVSGFRFQTNEGSRHYHAAAMDIRIPGVDAKDLYDFAETLDRGGMGIGIYPFAKFVHIDFRAPGSPSYRWVDISPKNYAERGREVSGRAVSK